ncbi:MAG: alkaline phosphatase family protein [Halarchaeum sp.]
MSDTLAVLALDAADLRLAREWECENLLLDDHGPLETFTHSFDHPFTPEVWTSVATGTHPREHGVMDDAADWDSHVLNFASLFTQFLPHELRIRLGNPLRDRGHRQEIARTDDDHAFEDGAVFGWPGISDSEHLSEAWAWAARADRGDLTDGELRSGTLGNTGQEIGWLIGMASAGQPIVGTHSHVLDITGHTYARHEERLREYYEHADEFVRVLREEVDRVVVLSDHGMQVSWLDDEDPGAHSMRAMVSATETVEGDLPETVFDVREWLEANTTVAEAHDEQVGMDTARERLEDLGYIN